MRRHIDISLPRIIANVAALAWLAIAASASASPLDGLLSGPAGSNVSSSRSSASQSTEATPVPFTQRIDVALTGAVSALPGSCQGTNCDGAGDCVAISFETAPAIVSTGPSANGSSGMSASSGSSNRRRKSTGKGSIRSGGPGALQSLSVCLNVDVGVQTPNGSGGVCMPASGIGVVNSQNFTAAGELCADANPDGSIYTLNASYGMEFQTPPGAGNLVEAIDANSGTATLLMRGTIGPTPAAVPTPTGSGGPMPK